MGGAVGLLRGGWGGAAGVRGGRRAQAAGEKAAHERGGRRVPHQAAAGCGHGGGGWGGKSESGQGNPTREPCPVLTLEPPTPGASVFK